MTSPILRIIIFTLTACGLAGALLYIVQPAPRRFVPDPSAAHHPRAHPPALNSSPADQEAGRPARVLSPSALKAAFATKPGASAAQSVAPADPEDLDLNDPAQRLPLARFALAYIGTDEVAESLWLHAINDPALSPEDRKNLIEDLNEDGFPDPKNLTAADLPLIEARLALIDRLAPEAMDDTNAAAFKEAHKDLLAMRTKLLPPPAHTEPPR
jgi:hypothetical protein